MNPQTSRRSFLAGLASIAAAVALGKRAEAAEPDTVPEEFTDTRYTVTPAPAPVVAYREVTDCTVFRDGKWVQSQSLSAMPLAR